MTKNIKIITKKLLNNGYFLVFTLIGLLYNIATLDNPDRSVVLSIVGFIPFAITAIAKILGLDKEN